MTIFTVVFCVVYQKRKMITLGFTKDNIIPQYLLGLLAGAVIFSAAVGLAAVAGALSIKVSSAPIDITLYLVLILGWIIQGMSEEVICRGFFLVSLSRKLSLPAAVVLNSLAFAAMHLFNAGISVLAFINLTLFGIFASVVFLRTGNIWLVSALHSVWNFAQGNFFGILVSGNDFGPTVLSTTFNASKTLINGGDFGLEGGLAVTTVLVIGTLLVLFVPSNKDGKVE
jgi:membrane protease YdiL (CAAX protease family)